MRNQWVEGLTLHCRAHNQLAAERDYGPDFMQRFGEGRVQRGGTHLRSTQQPQAPETANRAEPEQPDAVLHTAAASASDVKTAPVPKAARADSAKATSPTATLSGTSPAPAEVALPGRRTRRREPQPECVVLPGQLALPMMSQCQRAEQNEATAPPHAARRPAEPRAA